MTKPSGSAAPDLVKGIYAIVGISKNSGKTSFLNYLISHLNGKSLGVMTTGRDGEEQDTVYGNAKPAVRLAAGTVFTAVPAAFEKLGSAVDILDKLPFNAGNRQLWLLKSLRSLETEITGPAHAAAQIRTAEIMQARGADIILIDGSLERKSVVINPAIKGVFLVAGGSYGSLDKVTAELQRLERLSGIQIYKNNTLAGLENQVAYLQDGKWNATGFTTLLGNLPALLEALAAEKLQGIYLPGAVTDSALGSLKPILGKAELIVVRHPLHLHISGKNLESLNTTHKIQALRQFNLLALVLNSWSVTGSHLDCDALRSRVRNTFPNLKVIDICEV
jgi:hypothetical protein